MKGTSWLLLVGFALLLLGGLGPGRVEARHEQQETRTVVKLDGLKSRIPADGWVEEAPSNRLRLYQFRLTAVGDDKDNAEVTVFHFGRDGGSVEDNIKRWKSMFIPPAGSTINDVTKIEKMKVSEVPVVYVDLHGTYVFPASRFDPNPETRRRPNYRMLGVIFQTKDGLYFLRLLGPARTVEYYKRGFDSFVKGFK